jgi:hypothetical protein
MNLGSNLQEEGRRYRDLARRARRMAESGLSQKAERDCVHRYADELDARAAVLEAQVAQGAGAH